MMKVQVNDTDYASGVVIEREKEPGQWSVPAWDEIGQNLDGPFATRAEAEKRLADESEYLAECGYRVA